MSDEETSITTPTSSEPTGEVVEQDDNCPICFEPLSEGHLIRVFSCKHKLHQTCITGILDKCPLCRKDLTGEKLLCTMCGVNIPLVFTKGERVFQQCRECFRKTIAEECERVKRCLLNFYRITIGHDKMAHDIDYDFATEQIDPDTAYKRLRMNHVEMVDRLNNTLASSMWF
jgi:hypothetical protein